MGRPAVFVAAAVAVLAASAAATLFSGCGTNELRATIGLPTSETAAPGATTAAEEPAPAVAVPQSGVASGVMTVTQRQRAYLDEVKAAGLRPSSELLALSIGSYVCQARAARQNDKAVWDFVLPLVRGDIRTVHRGPVTPSDAEVDAATADYIRIATDQLC